MDVAVKRVMGIVLVLIVVLGIISAAFLVFDARGGDIEDRGTGWAEGIGCVLANPDDAGDCTSNTHSSVDVTPGRIPA